MFRHPSPLPLASVLEKKTLGEWRKAVAAVGQQPEEQQRERNGQKHATGDTVNRFSLLPKSPLDGPRLTCYSGGSQCTGL